MRLILLLCALGVTGYETLRIGKEIVLIAEEPLGIVDKGHSIVYHLGKSLKGLQTQFNSRSLACKVPDISCPVHNQLDLGFTFQWELLSLSARMICYVSL